ncbi:MAG: response regulator [Candidatus Moranbacteria bacterium]|nr:response regulator [Candidatus Moranbacteria bacterium]
MTSEIKTVLIVEDEEDLREIYSRALMASGYEILQANNGNEALEWLERKSEKIDLILLDIVMPGMDGFEALEKIKKDERYEKIPVLVSTNLDNDDDRRQALGMGAKEYFVKSKHTPSELVAKVKAVIN